MAALRTARRRWGGRFRSASPFFLPALGLDRLSDPILYFAAVPATGPSRREALSRSRSRNSVRGATSCSSISARHRRVGRIVLLGAPGLGGLQDETRLSPCKEKETDRPCRGSGGRARGAKPGAS